MMFQALHGGRRRLMASRKIEVEILGDCRSLEKALRSSSRAVSTFKQQHRGAGQPVNQACQITRRRRPDPGSVQARLEPWPVPARGCRCRCRSAGCSRQPRLYASSASRLETTGEAAFTTEGRLKNMVAALTTGDLVGAFKALTAHAKTFEDFGVSIERGTETAGGAEAGCRRAAAGVARTSRGARRRSATTTSQLSQGQEKLRQTMKEAGAASQEEAKILLDALGAFDSAPGRDRGADRPDSHARLRTIRDARPATSSSSRVLSTTSTVPAAASRWRHALDLEAAARGAGADGVPVTEPAARAQPDRAGRHGQDPGAARPAAATPRPAGERHAAPTSNGCGSSRHPEHRSGDRRHLRRPGSRPESSDGRPPPPQREATAGGSTSRARSRGSSGSWRGRSPPGTTCANSSRQIQRSRRRRQGFPEQADRTVRRRRQAAREEITPETTGGDQRVLRDCPRRVRQGRRTTADPLAGLMQASTKKLTGILAAGTGLTGPGRGVGRQHQRAAAAADPDRCEHRRPRDRAGPPPQQQARTGKRTANQTSGPVVADPVGALSIAFDDATDDRRPNLDTHRHARGLRRPGVHDRPGPANRVRQDRHRHRRRPPDRPGRVVRPDQHLERPTTARCCRASRPRSACRTRCRTSGSRCSAASSSPGITGWTRPASTWSSSCSWWTGSRSSPGRSSRLGRTVRCRRSPACTTARAGRRRWPGSRPATSCTAKRPAPSKTGSTGSSRMSAGPTTLRDMFTGNVRVGPKAYGPGTSALDAIWDAVDAEFPGVANCWMTQGRRVRVPGPAGPVPAGGGRVRHQRADGG